MRPLIAAPTSAVARTKESGRPAFFEREAPFGYALVLPAVLYLAVFIAYPFLMSIWMSFSDAQAGNQKWSWTGFANYSKVDAYQVLADAFHLASFKDQAEAEAFAAQREKSTVSTVPDGNRFKGVIHVAGKDIAVISPYDAQVQKLRELLRDVLDLEIDTVDGFQGREKEAVVVSLVRSNPEGELGFVADIRRINVALTRARKKLIVVGDSATIARHPFHGGFVRYAESIGAWRSAWDR